MQCTLSSTDVLFLSAQLMFDFPQLTDIWFPSSDWRVIHLIDTWTYISDSPHARGTFPRNVVEVTHIGRKITRLNHSALFKPPCLKGRVLVYWRRVHRGRHERQLMSHLTRNAILIARFLDWAFITGFDTIYSNTSSTSGATLPKHANMGGDVSLVHNSEKWVKRKLTMIS